VIANYEINNDIDGVFDYKTTLFSIRLTRKLERNPSLKPFSP